MSALRAYFLISRCEFAVGGVLSLLAVAAVVLGAWGELRRQWILIAWGALVWSLSHLLGSQVNCLTDHEVDLRRKAHLARAVERLGRRAVWLAIGVESALALWASARVGQLAHKSWLPALWILGWILAMGYSIEPFRLKRRGALNTFCLITVLYILPVAFGYSALRTGFDIEGVAILTCVGLQVLSLLLLSAADDLPEDQAMNIQTPCVRYGLRPVVLAALILFLVGSVPLIPLLAGRIAHDLWRWTFAFAALFGQVLIVRDMIALAQVSRLVDSTPGDERWTGELRRLGKRNPIHFAVVGLSFLIGGGLSLH